MRLKNARDWSDCHISSSEHEEIKNLSLNLKLLMCAMFERAWHDLSIMNEVEWKDRRSAIAWFRGIAPGEDCVSFETCSSILGMTDDRKRKLEERLKTAEAFNMGRMKLV